MKDELQGHDEKLRAAYRSTLIASLKEAEQRSDRPAQQRIRLLIELHDKNISTKGMDEDLTKAL